MPPKIPRTPAKKEVESAEELDALIHLRDGVFNKVASLKTKLAAIPNPERTAPVVRANRRMLEQMTDEFEKIHQRVILMAGANTRGQHDQKQEEFHQLNYEITLTLEKWTEDLVPIAAGPSSALAPARPQPIVIQQPLPRILPTFDGNYENWEKFKIMFRDVVDRSSEPDRIKLYHLEEALTGAAGAVIDAKTIQDGNYAHAWTLLEERFEDKRRMVDLHIGGLLRVKKLTKESHEELRSLVENFVSHVENLKFLGQEFTGVSEQIAVYLLTHALDEDTYKFWEATVKRGELPKYDEAVKFLKGRISVLERWESTKEAAGNQRERPRTKTSPPEQPYHIANTAIANSIPEIFCDLCGRHHLTFRCVEFANLTVEQRWTKVRESNLCHNCLRSGHQWKKCPSKYTCRKCHRRHHTRLHRKPKMNRIPVQQSTSACTQAPNAMLPTAVVNLRDNKNQPVPCRILLDSGSQVNFISESMAKRLGVQRVAANVPICGISTLKTRARESVSVELQSRINCFNANMKCLIVPEVTAKIPPSPVDVTNWEIPEGLQLADPQFNQPGRIDMIVGVAMFFRMLKSRQAQLSDDLPIFRETHLGWVIAGHGTVHDDQQPRHPVNVGVAISDSVASSPTLSEPSGH